jgi:nitrogen fixation NifU-like protein
MDDLRELYQQVILDHNRHPKNFGKIDHANRAAEGYNPLCGDRINLYLQVEDGVIKDISFQGAGCAISKASASVMTTVLKGLRVAEAEQLFKKFQKLITAETDATPNAAEVGKLAIFAGVREFPLRVKCASLAWHTMLAAVKDENKVVSTE